MSDCVALLVTLECNYQPGVPTISAGCPVLVTYQPVLCWFRCSYLPSLLFLPTATPAIPPEGDLTWNVTASAPASLTRCQQPHGPQHLAAARLAASAIGW